MSGRAQDHLGHFSALAAVFLWGLSFVATKQALAEFAPLTLIVVRFGVGVATLALLLKVRGLALVPPRASWPTLALMGFVGIFVHQLVQVHGLERTTAVRTGWLIGLSPIWTAALAAVFLRERFGVLKVTGLVLGLAGALLVITRGRFSGELLLLPSTTGDLLVLASTVNWAIYSTIGRRTLQELGSWRATFAIMTLGWLMVMPVWAAAGSARLPVSPSAAAIGSVLFLGIGCSALGYLFWYAALERLEASRVAAFLYLEPLVTMGAAVAVLREPVAVSTIAGGLLVIAGVLLVQKA